MEFVQTIWFPLVSFKVEDWCFIFTCVLDTSNYPKISHIFYQFSSHRPRTSQAFNARPAIKHTLPSKKWDGVEHFLPQLESVSRRRPKQAAAKQSEDIGTKASPNQCELLVIFMCSVDIFSLRIASAFFFELSMFCSFPPVFFTKWKCLPLSRVSELCSVWDTQHPRRPGWRARRTPGRPWCRKGPCFTPPKTILQFTYLQIGGKVCCAQLRTHFSMWHCEGSQSLVYQSFTKDPPHELSYRR